MHAQTGHGDNSDRLRQATQAAYVYGYPLVLMGATAQLGPDRANRFLHVPVLLDHSRRRVVRPNADTLYSIAWLDLRPEPLVLSLPAADRYYVMQLLDAWTNVFAAPGTRTLTGRAHEVAIVGPDWQGDLPTGLVRLDAPTNLVWIIGRTRPRGTDDLPAARSQQAGYTLAPLSRRGQPSPPIDLMSLAGAPPQAPPKEQVAAMDGTAFFSRLAQLLAWNPPAPADGPMRATLAELGLQPGRPFPPNDLPAGQRVALNDGAAAGHARLHQLAGTAHERVNGWGMPPADMPLGRYGTRYLQRAAVAHVGHGANLPEDAVYAGVAEDSDGRALDGSHRYRLRFAADAVPPVRGYWSLTVYDQDGWLIDNPIRRYAVSSDEGLDVAADDSVEIVIQHRPPPASADRNWLPAPPGSFNLTLRLYWPEQAVLEGRWQPPAIERLD